jgi:16S rRNA (guanine527-N7)-methyltransferase
MPDFVSWIKDKVKRKASMNCKMVFYLKGDLTEELKDFPKATQYDLADFFEDEF